MTITIGKLHVHLNNPRKSFLLVIWYGTIKEGDWFFRFHPYTFWPTCEGSEKSSWFYFNNHKL